MKFIRTASLLTSLLLSQFAFAEASVSVANDTDQTISLAASQIGMCTHGIPAHVTVTLHHGTLSTLCRRFEHDCIGEFYATNNCTGPVIARGHVDVDKGVVGVEKLSEFDISSTPDRITISH